MSINRKALTDFTFSNGTFIPAGTHVSAASYAVHRDEANYVRADEFDPFRFVDGDAEIPGRKQMVATGPKFLLFGYGKRAWSVHGHPSKLGMANGWF